MLTFSDHTLETNRVYRGVKACKLILHDFIICPAPTVVTLCRLKLSKHLNLKPIFVHFLPVKVRLQPYVIRSEMPKKEAIFIFLIFSSRIK